MNIRTKLRQGAKRSQLVMAFNLSLLAVALPLGWNHSVRKRFEEFQQDQAKKEKGWVAAERKQERLAVQIIVNERRVARGVSPYPYSELAALKPTTQTHLLLAKVAELHRMTPEKDALLRGLINEKRDNELRSTAEVK
jgi:hypothetical protein